MVSKVIAVHFLLLLYITSWKTLNLHYQNLQVLGEVEKKFLSSSLVMGPISKDVPNEPFREKGFVM